MKTILRFSIFPLIYKTQVRNFSYKKLLTWYSSLYKAKPTNPPYKHIIQIGDPRLRAISKEVPHENIATEDIQKLVHYLKHTLNEYNGLGLSATQIGVPLRIFVIELNRKLLQQFTPKEQQIMEVCLVEQTVVINPVIKITNYQKVIFNESCGSIKGFCADVPRYQSLQLTGLNEYAETIKIDAHGFIARMIQHEMDHFDGKLYTDIMDRKSFSCSCWEVVNERNGKVELPFGPV